MADKDDKDQLQEVDGQGSDEDELVESSESDESNKPEDGGASEDEAKPKPTFTKEEGPDEPADSRETEKLAESTESEASLDDLAKEEESDTDQQIPNLSSRSDPEYFQRNFTRGVNQTITPNRNRSSKIHLLILLIIGLVVIGGTVYLLKSQFPASSPSPSPSEIPQATPSPTPTPQALDRSKFKVRVLNGTSTTGLAASAAAKLKNLGYQTEAPRNATNSAFERTVVRIKGDVAGLLEQLIRDLAPEFEAVSEAALKDNDSANAEVILGKK